ncbi:phage baseplate assembly protein V [Enterobacter soli]
MKAQLTKIMRLITNLIRTGTETEVDRENWLCRVKVSKLETNWIFWLTLRAGGARIWWYPSTDEQVAVLCMGCNLEIVFVLPAIYSSQFAPPSDSVDGSVTQYPGGEYEPASGCWQVRGIKSMVIESADHITLKTSQFVVEADTMRINSNVVINGAVNRTYANRSNAERAAKTQWERMQRGVASFSLQLAEGRADLYTEMPVKVSGFKGPIDDAEWTISTLTHTVSPDNGFTTSLDLEVKIDEFEIE